VLARSKLRQDDNVVILGPGQCGILGVLAARYVGAKTVTISGLRRDAHRLALAKELPNTAIAGYGSGLVKAAADRLGAAHEQALFKLGETDYRGLVTRAKAFDPDVILMWGHGTPDEGTIMQQARELGISAPLFVGNGNPTSKVYREGAGKALEGVIYAGFKYDLGAAKKLVDAWRQSPGNVTIIAHGGSL